MTELSKNTQVPQCDKTAVSKSVFKLNSGVFSFLNRQGLSIHEMRRIISLYALSINIKRPKKARLEWYSKITDLAQEDFANFKKVFNKNKEIKKQIRTYDDWYQECSFDGSFAYNGVADDF